jgi:hypothetical protein
MTKNKRRSTTSNAAREPLVMHYCDDEKAVFLYALCGQYLPPHREGTSRNLVFDATASPRRTTCRACLTLLEVCARAET